jgi:ribosomal protein S18 acetylase RimI-like enzyme
MDRDVTCDVSTFKRLWTRMDANQDDCLKLIPCISEIHGEFVRSLTRENFYDIISRTIGWNEELYQQEPRFPERYSMVQLQRKIIGFFCIRVAEDHLYLHTIQIIFSYRNKGYGTLLLQQIEEIARTKNLLRIRLSVFKENPAQRLYCRLGYQMLEEDEHLIRMEKVL